jgi:glycine cleavage system H protein
MKIENYDFPDSLYYDDHHFWVRDDGDVLTMGVTD